MKQMEAKKMTPEQEIKQEMSKREHTDSFELTYGTPSKGSQVSLKCYVDFLQLNDTMDNPVQKKVDGLLQIREYLVKKGIILQ